MMVAILSDMLLVLKFLSTPMELEDHQDFHARLEDADEALVQKELDIISHKIQMAMDQTVAISSTLPKSLLQSIDIAYIRHLSAQMDLFGYKSGNETIWEEAYAQYVTDVATAFKEKAELLRKDDTDSPDLLLVNNQLVNKWNWIVEGIFSAEEWSTPTKTPLLTQSVIKDFDRLINLGATGMTAVCQSVNDNLWQLMVTDCFHFCSYAQWLILQCH